MVGGIVGSAGFDDDVLVEPGHCERLDRSHDRGRGGEAEITDGLGGGRAAGAAGETYVGRGRAHGAWDVGGVDLEAGGVGDGVGEDFGEGWPTVVAQGDVDRVAAGDVDGGGGPDFLVAVGAIPAAADAAATGVDVEGIAGAGGDPGGATETDVSTGSAQRGCTAGVVVNDECESVRATAPDVGVGERGGEAGDVLQGVVEGGAGFAATAVGDRERRAVSRRAAIEREIGEASKVRASVG